MKKSILISILFFFGFQSNSQINSAKVYWVGHSLISHTYTYTLSSNLIQLLDTMATSQSKTYGYYQHTTPGSPLGWNWGKDSTSWASSGTLIQPLINTSHTDYGTYDVIVLTEAIEITGYFYWWNSSFYARKFYNAAKKANSNTRLFLYESWHHYNAGDNGLRFIYGPMSTFNWKNYMLSVRPTWDSIIDLASNPALTQNDPAYVYQGTGVDPGIGNATLDIKIIPTGRVLMEVLDRLDSNLSADNWAYKGGTLKAKDFFQNPLANYPTDTVTKVHPADPLDDIHPSNVLAYLNSLVHYAVIYKDNPINLPAANGVPANIASVFKKVVWRVVTNDPRTGVKDSTTTTISELDRDKIKFKIYPNPTATISTLEFDKVIKKGVVSVMDLTGKTIFSLEIINKNSIKISTNILEKGIYLIQIRTEGKTNIIKLIKN